MRASGARPSVPRPGPRRPRGDHPRPGARPRGADFDRFYVLDDALHHALCDLSGHDIAWSLSQRAKGHLNRVRRLSLPEPGYLMEMISEHRAVVAAVADHDAGRGRGGAPPPPADGALEAARDPRQHPDYFEDEPEMAVPRSTRAATLSRPTCAALYEQMVLIRVFETEAERQYKAAKIGGYCHLSSGQEATTVGVVHACRRTTCWSPATAATASRSRAGYRRRP